MDHFSIIIWFNFHLTNTYDYSNFAEIIIYNNSINIILDIPYEDLEDELNLVENISDKGSWGTGNCRIKVNSPDNLEYIMSLINASLQNEKMQIKDKCES